MANSYYMRIPESLAKEIRPIYTVLTSYSGDVDLYAKLQTNSDLVEKSKWSKPNSEDYEYKSTNTGKTDTINVSPEALLACIQRSKKTSIYGQEN